MATPTKAELLETAAQLGLKTAESMTVKELQSLIAGTAENAPEVDTNEGENRSILEEAPEAPRADETVEDVTPVTQPSADASAGASIAQAITEGIKSVTDKKQIVITTDPNVQPRFSVVRNRATGEFMVRDNESRVLSAVQLKSVEEKEAALQETDVEER